MKNVLIKVIATIFIFLLSGIISNIYSEEWIEKVVENKKFDVNQNALLIIDHEFGNVKCKNWDQNSISIKVTVRIKTENTGMTEKILSNITIDVHGNKDKVVAMCDLNQKKFGDRNVKVNIDFDILMPETISLELNHKFGNAFIESVSGPTSISSEYGNIEIGSLSNLENDFEISFGEAGIKNIANGSLEISYSRLSAQKAIELSVESEYSDISFGDVDDLSLEMEGGNANIENIRNLEAETNFTNLEVTNILESILAETNYGNLSVKNVDSGFTSVAIVNEFGAVNINIEKESSYKLDIEGEYCKFSYPDKLADFSYKKEGHSSTSIKGNIGAANSKSTVSINSEYGAVTITAK